MSIAHDVLRRFPAADGGTLTPLGNYGGFSGARLFRVVAPSGAYCLRAWPADLDPLRLGFIHCLMESVANRGLEFVPHTVPTRTGGSYVCVARRLWDLTTWMSGSASFWHEPSLPRLRAACVALARLHRVWNERHPFRNLCDSLERRCRPTFYWGSRIAAGWSPPDDPRDPVAPWAQRAWAVLRTRLREIPRMLGPWLERQLWQQPVLCDIWHDHVLFIGDRVTGIVDYGSVNIDNVAVDLARLLGSLAGDDRAMWEAGLDAYAQLRKLSVEERALAEVLDRTGVIVAAANWLRWLYVEGRVYADRAAVARRLAALVERLERE